MLKRRHILCYTALLLLMGTLCCPVSMSAQSAAYINPSGTTVETRFILPKGYERVPAARNSYAYFLRRLQMLPYGTVYNNSSSESHYAGILNMPLMNNMLQDTQLCIRLRGEYLFKREQYDNIAFTISNLDRVFYVPWVEGLKLVINDKRYWTKQPKEVDRLRSFRNYLSFIFTHSNVNTLLVDVQSVPVNNIMPGDMFIRASSSSGHAVIVLDVAYNPATGDRIFLLAKTYKSARTACVLINPKDAWSGSPWHTVKAGENRIATQGFTFYRQDLRRFQDVSMTTKK